MLLLLQTRRRTTARELAEELEVSVRTVLRDVEALGEAGVPIYATRGAGGGIELLDGFRSHLTGLTIDEARTLFLAGQPGVAHRLGLEVPARVVRNKLLNALTVELAGEAESLSNWFVHDPDPWRGNKIPHGELRRVARCIHECREAELFIGHDADPIVTRPLGLVLKAGSWHLIATQRAARTATSVLCIDALRAIRVTNRRFERPERFDLESFWRDHVARADT